MALSLVDVRNFTGGLNLRADVFQLAENETSDLLNVEIDPRGGFFARGGMRRINATAVGATTWNPQKLHGFETNANAKNILLSLTSKVYKSTGGNFSVLQTGAATDLSVTASYGADIADWGNEVYFATGLTSQGARWDGGTYATLLTASGTGQWQNDYATPTGTHMPKAQFIEAHNDTMFVANVNYNSVSYPNRVHWSHTFKPQSWAENDWVDIEAGGPEILGIQSIKGHLLVFKQFGIYAIYGYSSDTYQVVTVSETLGVANPNSFAKTDQGVFFFDFPNGMFFYNGTGVVDVFEPLRPMITERQLNEDALSKISVFWLNRRAWLSLPYDKTQTATQCTTNFVYDPSIGRGGAWTKFRTYDGYGLVGGFDWFDSNDNRLSIAAHPTQQYVASVDNYDSYLDRFGAESGYETFYTTKWFDGGNYASKKMWKRPVFVLFSAAAESQLDVEFYRDFNSGTPRGNFTLALPSLQTGLVWRAAATEPDAYAGWGQGDWAQEVAGALLVKGRNLGVANSIQMKISGPSGLQWAVNAILLKFNARPVGS